MSTQHPRASQRFSTAPAPVSPAPSTPTTTSYSFASPKSSLPPPFSSRRTSNASISTAATSSFHHSSYQAPATPTFRSRASILGVGAIASPSIHDSSHDNNVKPVTSSSSSLYHSASGVGGSNNNHPVPDIIERPRDKTRNNEVALSSLTFLFAEMVSYTQARVSGITDLEKRLSLLGYHIGTRLLSLTLHRQEMTSNPKQPKRETRLLPTLLWIHGAFWKAVFGKQADSLERSTETGRGDEYMISTNTPSFSKSITIPKEMSQLSVEAITAGIVEAALDGLGFPARVTAHSVPMPEHPNRTTILIKLDKSVMDREEAFGS